MRSRSSAVNFLNPVGFFVIYVLRCDLSRTANSSHCLIYNAACVDKQALLYVTIDVSILGYV
jgi:hypothetical protein